MKIVFFIQDISTDGGTERTTCCLAEELAGRGHKVSIVSVFRSNQVSCYRAEGIETIYLTNISYTLRENRAVRLLKAWRQVEKVRACDVLQQADIVICQKVLASMLAYLAGFADKSIACEHYKYGMYSSVIRRFRRKLYRQMKAVVVLTENDRRAFVAEGIGTVRCIPNMVSIRPLPYAGKESRRIVSVGRLTYQKGYDLLLQAVKEIADQMGDYYIEVYGEGEELEQLEAQRAALAIEQKIRFCGYTKEIEQVYSQSAFYVMSSRFEGFPMVLLEAAAAGLPLVSFDCPEGPAVLLAQGGGLLAHPEDPQNLAALIMRMIREPELRERCHEQTSDIIRPYQPNCIGTQWEQLLNSLIQNNNE